MTGLSLLGRLRRRAQRSARPFGPGEDRGSIAMALLVGLIGSGIVAVLIPMVVVQIHTSTFDNSRARQLNAAQSGTSVALAMIRAAVEPADPDSPDAGDVASLPCTAQPITGTVGGSGTGLTYRSEITYFTLNPLGHLSDPDWLKSQPTGGNAMICAPGAGPYYPPTKVRVPSYILITSTGSDDRGSRTLRSIYYVQTTNANIAGGTIYIFPPQGATTTYCMDAGTNPGVGTQVVLQPCSSDPVLPQQSWAYRSDLSIQLVASVAAVPPNGLCLSSTKDSGNNQDQGNQAPGDTIVLAACQPLGQALSNQQWSVDDAAHFEGAKKDQSDIDGLCIQAGQFNSDSGGSPPVPGAGAALQLGKCTGGTTDPFQTWKPSPDVGPGMAGAANHQIVNFSQFTNCIDVTNHSATGGVWTGGSSNRAGNLFLIAYTCKQNPDPGKVAWNQKFVYSNGQIVTTTDSGAKYCMQSPLTAYDKDNPNKQDPSLWVTVVPCPAQPTAATTWQQFGGTYSNGNPLPPGTKYAIKDSNGLCLSLTIDSAVAFNGQYSKLIVDQCDTSELNKLQMWNGSPDLQTPGLRDLTEVSLGSAN